MVTEKMIEALKPCPFCGYARAEAAISTDAEPVKTALEISETCGGIDRQKAADAAVKANHSFGQWMPERWLHLFLDAYEGKI